MQRVNLGSSESNVRAASVALAQWATGPNGRIKGDPVFEEVTEHRQRSWLVNGKLRSHSACADLAHWTFWNLLGATKYNGVLRSAIEPWINRTEAYGWKVGWNISKLRYKCPAWRSFKKGECDAKPGDAMLVGEGGSEHVFIVTSNDGTTLYSRDYGQFFNPTPTVRGSKADHGGKVTVRTIRIGPDGRRWAGATSIGRPCIGVVDCWALYQKMSGAGTLEYAVVTDGFVPSDNPY